MKQPIIRIKAEDIKAEDVNLDCLLSGYDYELPPGLIAQNPAVPRDSSRLLVVDSPETAKTIPPLHHVFRDLSELLKPGDLLVMNNTKVIPARLYGCKSTGAGVEVLLLEERRHNCWLALVKPGKRFTVGSEIIFTAGKDGKQQELRATVVESDPETGGRLLQFDLPAAVPLVQVLEKFGQIPLPPYITASTAAEEQYQTVYADVRGAIAAPTAGLHFTPELLEKLRSCGINQAFITLHVGVGTFRPVEVEDITTHAMHEEWIEVPPDTVEQIRSTQAAGGRIIAGGDNSGKGFGGCGTIGGFTALCGEDQFIYFSWV